MNRLLIGVLMIISTLNVGVAFAGTEVWGSAGFKGVLKEGVKLGVILEPRYQVEGGELYYLQTYLGPSFSLSKELEMSVYYALKQSKSGGSWGTSHYNYLDLVCKKGLFDLRGRLENDMTQGNLKVRGRAKLKLAAWSLGDEMFYNYNKGYVDEGRSSLDYALALPRDLKLSLGFLLRRQRADAVAEWTWTNVLSLGIFGTF